jgi:predicted restriction endonuclease
MTVRPCLVCGRLNTGVSYCPRHNPERQRRRVTPGRVISRQERFRKAVLAAAGHRCQWTEDGRRCKATTGLQAHHLQPLRDSQSYDPADGVALCRHHHALAERALPDAAA